MREPQNVGRATISSHAFFMLFSKPYYVTNRPAWELLALKHLIRNEKGEISFIHFDGRICGFKLCAKL